MADSLREAVRDQLGLGRLLPLGEAKDGAWIAETAVAAALRPAAARVPGIELRSLRLTLADPEVWTDPAVTPPASALPPGPLRITAECAAVLAADRSLRDAADALRSALFEAADLAVGLEVTAVDVQVTDLLESAPPPAEEPAGLAAPVVHRVHGELHMELPLDGGRVLDTVRQLRSTESTNAAVLVTSLR
ncbi:hypothetical protein G5C51_09960 [Streptomyces sp. A7024]|uniref:Nucleopolyhedrovirus P10 family protein n=1 Tax=Streptomyces coryli TaxID=1128680 RepID=A0A6G4TW65_9ACTN|nr:hypothetical protein [Streptomyces coryli]NGN64225.1 hypothetical protein [Streptomyces coryli]